MQVQSSSGKRTGFSRILVLPGGNNASMVQFPEICDCDLVIVVNATNELARNLPKPLPSYIKPLPLGQGHTARTLAAGASSTVRRLHQHSAGMDAEAGWGNSAASATWPQRPCSTRTR